MLGSFHERFDIDVGVEEAQRRFVNRAFNLVIDFIDRNHFDGTRLSSYGISQFELTNHVATVMGERYEDHDLLESYVQNDFYRCIQVLEALYKALEDTEFESSLTRTINTILDTSEIDLGIRWQPPIFIRTGAQLLDENLVNEPLRWLSEPKYMSVRKPFEKGLSHYLEATNRPDRLTDVITDMYEAIEALAKSVTGRDKDLSGNREVFIKSIKVSDYYKRLLKDYTQYGSEFRHAERLNKPRPPLSEPEVESFIYLTGLFIRLAIRQA